MTLSQVSYDMNIIFLFSINPVEIFFNSNFNTICPSLLVSKFWYIFHSFLGWIRRPVDSLRDLNDRGGLFTHCVDIRLANGTVLYQDLHPERPSCRSDFLRTWRETLRKEYKMDVSVICCEWNRCNGPNAMGTRPESHFFLHFALAVIVLIKNMLPS